MCPMILNRFYFTMMEKMLSNISVCEKKKWWEQFSCITDKRVFMVIWGGEKGRIYNFCLFLLQKALLGGREKFCAPRILPGKPTVLMVAVLSLLRFFYGKNCFQQVKNYYSSFFLSDPIVLAFFFYQKKILTRNGYWPKIYLIVQ